jgi:2-desacetyl-2-hydroxyethyl bacteriochlorophyllide A dehydrogenase
MMKAAVLAGPQQIQLTQVALPKPKPGEVRVRLEGCGVCASNLEVWTGQPWFEYPLSPGSPGHEGWGIVDAIGSDVEKINVGDRVAMLSNQAYAEYDVAASDAVVRLPSILDNQPFPGEPLSCAVNIFRRSKIKAEHTVAIVGVGFLGALLTQLAARAGARVIAISRRPFALEMAREFGATEVIAMDDHTKVVKHVRELTEGRGCERVIEAVGKQWPLDLAAELTAERARLIIAGYHQDGPRQVNMQLWNWRGLDVINAHERDPKVYMEGMRAAVEAVINGEINPGALYTHTFPLEGLADALEMMRKRPLGFIKGIIKL